VWLGKHLGSKRRIIDVAKPLGQPGAWQFLYVDGKLVGPVKIGEMVRVYPDMDLADLAGLHRKRFKTVEDMLAAVRLLLPNAKRLEIRGDHTVVGELLALLDSKRVALNRSSSTTHSAKRTVKAGPTKRRT
jgi:hypothetical protein